MTDEDQGRTESELLPVVAAALIDGEGRILVQQRPPGKGMAGLWEFPGGKIEPGETPEEALVRELAEELGIAVTDNALSPLTFSSASLGRRHLLLLLYICRCWEREPRPLDATALQWVNVDALVGLDMPPADRPLVEALTVTVRTGG